MLHSFSVNAFLLFLLIFLSPTLSHPTDSAGDETLVEGKLNGYHDFGNISWNKIIAFLHLTRLYCLLCRVYTV